MLATALLHGDYHGPFLLAWDIEAYIGFGLIFAAGLYWLALRRISQQGVRAVPRSYPLAYYAGLFALAAAVSGPFHTFNESSFTLHMGQHVLMMLVAAPLLVLGRPVQVAIWTVSPQWSGAVLGPVLRRAWVRRLLIVLTNPVVVLLLINVNLVIWHVPAFYVAALENTLVHEIQHMLFMSTAMLFWWVIIDPIPRHHQVRPDIALVMLFVSGTVGDLVALYLIFAPDVAYPFYLASDTLWSMSQLADQRVGGLVMLTVGTAVYFGATFMLIARNYAKPGPAPSPATRQVVDAPDTVRSL